MASNPKVSVITPVYNGGRYIRECIESVLAQNYPNLEHVIVDDGSEDDTLLVIGQYPHVRLLTRAHGGATAARNAGLQVATGDYVKFLDADDVLVAGALSGQVSKAGDLPAGIIGYGHGEKFFDSGRPPELIVRDEQGFDHPVVDCICRNILISMSLYPRAALLDIGGFDERLHSGQEWNLNIRLAVRGYRFVSQNILVFRYRIHDSAHRISNRKIDWVSELQNFDYSFETVAGLHDRVVLDAWAAYLWNFGRRALREGSPAGGQLFFDRARQISGNGFKRFLQRRYCLALALLGPGLTERLIGASRRWRQG